MKIVVRPIEEKDLQAVQAIYKAAALAVDDTIYMPSIKLEWANRTDEEFIAKSSCRQRFVAEIDELVVGYAGYDLNRSTLTECYVSPVWQGLSIGSNLIRHMLHLAYDDGLQRLTVLASANAVLFYEKIGFYLEREEALVMGDGQLLDCYRMSIFVTDRLARNF